MKACVFNNIAQCNVIFKQIFYRDEATGYDSIYHIRRNKRPCPNKRPSPYFPAYRADFSEHASF